MNTFFRKIAKMQEDLEKDLEVISESTDNFIKTGEAALLKIDENIRNIKKLVKNVMFDSIADEVYFFKHIKPFFISRYIFYSKQIRIESLKPSGGQKVLKKYYTSELQKLSLYYTENNEFYKYYRRDATYLDHKYFTRKSFDLKMNLPTSLYDYDEDFTTSHDHKISILQAHEMLEDYILKSINDSENPMANHDENRFNISWTASKVSLIELIYALHKVHCFNGGNIEFSEVIRFTEKSLNISLGNYYKTLNEIKSRKNNRTKFLQLLNDNLNQLFLDSDQ